MDAADYRRFGEHLRSWAEAHPDVIGLVAVGSMAEQSRMPDEWSDHDFWVITTDAAAEAIRDDPSWLPDAERIVLFYAETEHGRNAIYDDGHLIEQAVFRDSELEVARVNDYRVLVDKATIGTRMEAIVQSTGAALAAIDLDTTFGRFIGQMVIGLTRCGRGELLSADSMIRKWALENLLSLLGQTAVPETDATLDNLDPRRRFEAAFPALSARLTDAGSLPESASAMLDIAEEYLTDVPTNTAEVRAAVRRLIERVD
ncbi:MAG: hypothetical protein HKN80_00825 [Acidimicrobiia bacterium]|nr:hypothetical protein [Acidimicrobiia bacterium]